MNVYDIACHYMSHGSFSYSGLQVDPPHEPFHNGRLKLALLAKILDMPKQCGRLGTIFLPADFNKDCRENFKDFADFAEKWLESTDPNQGGASPLLITYQVEDCNRTGTMGLPGATMSGLRFSAEVEGNLIKFRDMVHANCCLYKMELTMTLRDNLIRILESVYSAPCWCICDWPTTATLGPFDEGTYLLEVYQRTGGSAEELIGWTIVIIGPG
jgi:hypothetical protein